MSVSVPFQKLQGCGNDFILIDQLTHAYPVDWQKAAPTLCHRQFGIGADGILLVLPPTQEGHDVRMRIINSDGSEAQMCGNGIRAFARYLAQRGFEKTTLAVETLAGTIRPTLVGERVRVDMGMPRLEKPQIPMQGEGRAIAETLSAQGKEYRFTAVSMGNPHCVIFVDEDPDGIDLTAIGPVIETHPLFPEKTNVEFAQVLTPDRIKMRVWERGAGITLACGTGACATLVAASLNGLSGNAASLELPGGTLFIEWEKEGRVSMTGPADFVYSGLVEVGEV